MNQLHKPLEGQPVSVQVVMEVADVAGLPPETLTPPLYDVIDPDALNALFQSETSDGCIEFSYCGYEIAVHSDGRIAIET